MRVVNVHQAKTNLSALLAELEATGEEILICRNGRPVADLVPHRGSDRLKPDPELSRIKILYDPTEPLSPDEWRETSNDS